MVMMSIRLLVTSAADSIILSTSRLAQDCRIELDRSDRFARDGEKLENADDSDDCAAGPSSHIATSAVEDADKRRRDCARKAACGHGETVDFAENQWRRRSILQHDEGDRVEDDVEEALQDETDVDCGGREVDRQRRDEGHHDVGDREEDDRPDDRLPDTNLLNEDGKDHGLDEETNDTVHREEDANVVDSVSETTDQVQVARLRARLVQDVGWQDGEKGHAVVRDDDEGDREHDDCKVEGLALVGWCLCSAGTIAGQDRATLRCLLAKSLDFLRGKPDGVHRTKRGLAKVEDLANTTWQPFFDEGRSWRSHRSRHALAHRAAGEGDTAGAVSVRVKWCSLGHDADVVDRIILDWNVTWVGLLKKDHALNDGQDDDHNCDQVGKQVWVATKQAIFWEDIRVEARRLREEASHSRADDATKRPDKRLHGIRLGCMVTLA